MEPSSLASPPTRLRTIARRIASILWTVLILATVYVCYFSQLGIVGFVGPDEPRYASIARAMSETGDWVTPRLNSKPWFEKPPLYYWAAATSFKLFGVSEATARLPSAIFALLGTLAIAWLAWRIYGAETARWLLLVLPTTVGMIAFSHAAATDMPFAAMLTLAMVPAVILLGLVSTSQTDPTNSSSPASFSSSTSFTSVLLGFFLGLAVLAKGPAALILCAGGVALWALFTSRWRDTLRLLHPAAIAAFCLTALPWYVLCAYRNPDFFRVFIIEHNFKRFLTPEFQHVQPFWFYGEILLIAFLPWTAPFLCSRIAGSNRLRRVSLGAPTLFLLSWSLFCILFFTISRSKLPGYVLPAIPPLGLILARSCTLLAQSKRSRQAVGVATVIFAAIFGAAFYAVLTNPDHILKRVTPFAPIIGLALLLFTLTNLFFGVFLLFNRRSAALISATLPFFAYFWLFDELAKFTPLSIQSPRYAAQQIAAQQIPVSALRAGGLKRSTLYGLNFYLRTDLQEWDRDTSGDVYVLTDGPMPCPLQMTQPSCEDLWEEIDRIGGSLELLHLKPRTSDPHAR